MHLAKECYFEKENLPSEIRRDIFSNRLKLYDSILGESESFDDKIENLFFEFTSIILNDISGNYIPVHSESPLTLYGLGVRQSVYNEVIEYYETFPTSFKSYIDEAITECNTHKIAEYDKKFTNKGVETLMSNEEEEEEEVILYLETADGQIMRVPESKLKNFQALNRRIKADMEQKEKAKFETETMSLDGVTRAVEEMIENAGETPEQAPKDKTQEILSGTNIPIPMLDINGLMFADEDTQKAEMTKYANEMVAYVENKIRK